MKTNILCVVVLYGNRLHESVSYRAVRAQAGACGADVAFYVHDNSPEADPEAVCSEKVVYCHCPENCGLGAAYNAAAKYASEHDMEWILLLDQDTALPDGFLRSYVEAIEHDPQFRLFVPQVNLSDGKPMSPLRRWRPQRMQLKQGTTYSLRRYMLINSGLCMKTDTFLRCGGYDERIWLDFADTQFCFRLLHHGIERFYLLKCTCLQNFSNEEIDPERLKSRFEIYLRCARACRNYDFSDWFFRQYGIVLHTISLSRRTRSCFFLKKFFSEYVFHC